MFKWFKKEHKHHWYAIGVTGSNQIDPKTGRKDAQIRWLCDCGAEYIEGYTLNPDLDISFLPGRLNENGVQPWIKE